MTTATETVHQCPPDGSGLMPCCGRTPFEVPDRMTQDPALVTCGKPPAATHYQDETGWHPKHDVYGGPHDEPPQETGEQR